MSPAAKEAVRRRPVPTDPEALRGSLCHPKGDLKACLLLMIAEHSAYGYELVSSLGELGYDAESPARIYRALRWLEEAGLLEHTWQESGAGPDRRVYALTPKGADIARACTEGLRARNDALAQYLTGFGGPSPGAERRSFEVVVEAKLAVVAPDAATAAEAVGSALSGNRPLGEDVRVTGDVSIYDAVESTSGA